MKFFDCPSPYSQKEVFGQMVPEELQLLQLDTDDRKILFRPVVTDPSCPVRMAFVGLAAYCGNDYREAVQQPNFAAWCQKRYNQKLFTVMDRYMSRIHPVTQGPAAAYYTDFVKVVLPASHFKGERPVREAVDGSPRLMGLFTRLLGVELGNLARSGCRVIVCFGNAASTYVDRTLRERCKSQGRLVSDQIAWHAVGGQSVCIVHERHYAYYSKDVTERLLFALGNELAGRT